MVTSFTRFIIVFSILRAGMGLPTTPANLILVSLALFMTFYVMSPTFDRAWNEGIQPLDRRGDQRAGSRRTHLGPVPGFHDQQCAREGISTFSSIWRASAARTEISIEEPDLRHPRAGLHDFRDQAWLRDGLP